MPRLRHFTVRLSADTHDRLVDHASQLKTPTRELARNILETALSAEDRNLPTPARLTDTPKRYDVTLWPDTARQVEAFAVANGFSTNEAIRVLIHAGMAARDESHGVTLSRADRIDHTIRHVADQADLIGPTARATLALLANLITRLMPDGPGEEELLTIALRTGDEDWRADSPALDAHDRETIQ